MIQDQLTPDRIQIAAPASWEEAIRWAGKPLEEDGSVEERYIEQVVANVREPGGTYMDLGFGYTLAHARPEAGAIQTAVALLILEEPLDLADSPEHPMRVVVFLAASDVNAHQQTMAELAKVLMDSASREALAAARTVEEASAVIASVHH